MREGSILKLKTGQTGEFVKVGAVAYLDDGGSFRRVEALLALDNLVKRGLVCSESELTYLLTPAGFKKARKCKSKSRQCS